MSIESLPAPATVSLAVKIANHAAYGFDKHKDDGYWDGLGYLRDPQYFFDRMCGWQAGPADQAKFGKWAVPPTPWNPPDSDGGVDPPPADDGKLAAIMLMLRDIGQRQAAQEQAFTAFVAESRGAFKQLASLALVGTQVAVGKKLTLKPGK